MNDLKFLFFVVPVVPNSYLILSGLIDLDDFYWLWPLLVTLTLIFPIQGHMVFYVNLCDFKS